MWQFFSKIRSLFASSGLTASRKRPDEDWEFTLLEPPSTPAGLENLQVERIGTSDALLLRGFDVDLTVSQTSLDYDPKDIAWSSRCLRWAVKYHGLEEQPTPPVRLHTDNVILLGPHLIRSDGNKGEAVFSEWLKRFDWAADRPLFFQQTATSKPIEDGFFRCVRVVAGNASARPNMDDQGLRWQPYEHGSSLLPEAFARFMRGELVRVGVGDLSSCETFIRGSYETVPPDQLTHPAFALLDYPIFHMGSVVVEFAGSVRSAEELRFWSRAAYYHK